MNKKKIIAKEVNPSHQDFSIYFDDDGLKSCSGENCACYIPPVSRNHCGFNTDEYKEIQDQAERIIDGFNEVADKWTNGYNGFATYKEAIEYNNVSYTSRRCHLLKEWVKTANTNNTDDMAEYLTITTGEKWTSRSFCGYSQGDYCEVVYCKDHYSEDHITEIGKLWLGCGTEFMIDDCAGYYVIDEIRWEEGDRLRKSLAEAYGCKPDELEIHLFAGEHTVSDYEVMAS